MKINPIKLCREPWSKPIQHLPQVRFKTKMAQRWLRHKTKQALKQNKEPPVQVSGGDRY